jgi:AcrR family transcriptional regulator
MTATRHYTKVARAESEGRTRAALLDAAEDAFFERRWEQITLEAVAAAAGVTKPTLLRHFGSKDGLFEQSYARAFERVRAQRMAAPAGDIEAAVENLLDHYDEHGDRALKLSALSGRGLIADVGANARELHYEWVEHTFEPWLSTASDESRTRLHRALVVVCDVLAWKILARDLSLPRDEVRATLVLAIHRLLEEDR